MRKSVKRMKNLAFSFISNSTLSVPKVCANLLFRQANGILSPPDTLFKCGFLIHQCRDEFCWIDFSAPHFREVYGTFAECIGDQFLDVVDSSDRDDRVGIQV